jgi:hypothetical protein
MIPNEGDHMTIRSITFLAALLSLSACDGADVTALDPGDDLVSADPIAPVEPELTLLSYEDAGAREFLLDALSGQLPEDATYTYEVLVTDADGLESWVPVTLGVSDEAATDAVDIALMSEYTLNWCEAVGPSVSKTIWATSCSKSTAKDTARSWAISLADDTCEATISTAGGAAACAPDNFSGGVCVTGGGTWTSVVETGSDTACGIWPFRSAKWKATYAYTGDCGYNCATDPFEP